MTRHGMYAAFAATALWTPALAAAPPVRDAFPLVAQALGARHALRFTARQDVILMPTVGPDTQMTQIVTDVTRDGRRVRMVYWLPADAARRVVVDDGRWFHQWEPARRLIVVDQSHEESATLAWRILALLHRNYRCVRRRRERVNGLSCDVVAVLPRHGTAPSRLLWIERGRHAILRTEEYDAAGRCCYQSCFETFRFVPRVSAKVFSLPSDVAVRPAPHATRDVATAGAAFAAAGIAGRIPAWLPAGYTLLGCAVSGHRPQAALLRYGDGLKMVSVFEEASPGADGTDRWQEALRREMARYGQQAWVGGDASLRITVLGDAALPDSLGQDLLRALSGDCQARLTRRLADEFGLVPANALRQGWSCAQAAALGLYLRAHPGRAGIAAGRLREGWPQLAAALHTDTGRLDGDARRWIAAALAQP